jgi:hypothetical protein
VRIFRENEGPLGGQGGLIVECDTDVTDGLRHRIDADGENQITRDGYEERVEPELGWMSKLRGERPFLSRGVQR